MNLTVLPKPSIIKSRLFPQHQKSQVTIACSKMIQSHDAWKSKRFQITHDKNYFIFNFASLQCFLCFAFFCSVNHFGEGEVNADHNVTCSPSLAENELRLLKNSEGNRDDGWIFCRRKEADNALLLQVTRMRKIIKIWKPNLTSRLLPKTGP